MLHVVCYIDGYINLLLPQNNSYVHITNPVPVKYESAIDKSFYFMVTNLILLANKRVNNRQNEFKFP